MKTLDKLGVIGIVPLFEKRVLMAHVASDLDRSWLGPVVLRCGDRAIRMQCVGVGETGGEPTVMLRASESDGPPFEELVASLHGTPQCARSLERVAAT
jgi:hypothetical protein